MNSKENKLRVTTFLSAFFSNEEVIVLQTVPCEGIQEPKEFLTTNLEELKEEQWIKDHLMKENKTKNVSFFVNSRNDHSSKIIRYNAFYIRFTTLTFVALHKILDVAPLVPSIRVETKDAVYAFWLIEGGCSSEEWVSIQRRLIAYFKADNYNKSPIMAMRLPLFNQVSCIKERYSYRKVEAVVFNPSQRFTVEEMKTAFPPKGNSEESVFTTTVDTKEELKQWFDRLKQQQKTKLTENQHSSKSSNSSFVSTETETFPVLDNKALYGLAGEIVTEIAKDSESHPSALLIQFLAAFGNIIGFSPYFKTEADAQGVNLYTVVVGKSARGGRKGTSWGNINALFSKVEPTWAVNNLQSGGLSSGEGLITRLRDANGDDSGVEDKRLLVVEGEFASVLRVKGRETNTLDAILRNAWDRKPLSKMISSKVDSMAVTDPHFSFIGHITEEELKLLLKDVDAYNGYANRILWVCTSRTQRLPRGGGFFDRDINSYVNALRNAITSASKVEKMDFDDEANQIWTDFYLNIDDTETGSTAAILSRAEPQVIRLSMLYALLDQSNIIHKVHLEAALALWQYCEDSVRYIFGKSLSAGAIKLLEALRESGDKGLSRSDIITDVFNKNKSKAEIDSWLTELRHIIYFDSGKKLYFSKESNHTNNEFDDFDEPRVPVNDSNQLNSGDMGVKS